MGPLTEEEKDDMRVKYYWHVHMHRGGRNEPRWRGNRVVKFPNDMILYAEKIMELRPDFIVETGTAYGGSALFLADMLLLNGGTKVFSIDVKAAATPPHPMVEYITGSSTDKTISEKIKSEVAGGKVMVVLDSDHSTRHVRNELRIWHHIVTSGQYLVVEDSYSKSTEPYKPYAAVEWFLTRVDNFRLDPLEDRFIMAITRHGWLKKL